MGISPSRDWCNILAAGTYHRFWWFGDTDEITGIPAICEYTLRPVGICNFCISRLLPALLSISPVHVQISFPVIEILIGNLKPQVL